MTTKKKLGYLVGIMLLLIIAGGFIVNIYTKSKDSNINQNQNHNQKQDQDYSQNKNTLQVVTTFYPMYIIAENLFDQMEGVTVTNLTDFNAGCAHDYQLTTDNMKILATADIIIVNGGGLEGFLEDVIANFPNLTIIDSSDNIPMLAYDEVDHNHEVVANDGHEDEHSNIEEHMEHDEVDVHNEESYEHDSHDGHDHGEYNSHIWLDPTIYVKQIQNIQNGILNYLKESITGNELDTLVIDELTTKLEENSNSYINKVLELDQRLEELSDTKPDDNIGVAIFHDTFAYLAKRLGLQIEYMIEVDSESALSAKDIKNIIDLIRVGKIQYLFAENQYGEMVTERIQGETEVEVFVMDPVIIGDGSKDSYINAMEANIQLLEEVLQ